MLKFTNKTNAPIDTLFDSKRYTTEVNQSITINDSNPELVAAFRESFSEDGQKVDAAVPDEEVKEDVKEEKEEVKKK